MTPTPRELKIRGGDRILNMIRQFSATEKVIFGVFLLALIVTALLMLVRVNAIFMVPIPSQGGTYTEAEIGLPRLVNPVIAISDVDRDISTLVYAGLMKYTGGKLTTDLANKYTVSEDGLTYSFTLRDDIRFHDGTQVTTDDVEFTIQKIQDPTLQSPRRVEWKDVSIKKVSSNQIEFTLKQPYAPFINNLTVGIIPKHIWKNVDTNQFIFSQFNVEPIGAGPYRLEKVTRDGGGIPISYRFTPFPRYQNGEAYIEELVLNFFPNEKAALEAFESGRVDGIAAVSSSEANRIATTTPSARILSTPLPRLFALFLNQNTVLFTNKEVRQALDMSVDKTKLVHEVLDDYGVRIDGPTPYGTFKNLTSTTTSRVATSSKPSSTASLSTASSTKELARALLEKNGWTLDAEGVYEKKDKSKKPGPTQRLEFTITTADASDLKQTAEFIKNEWQQIGARVTIKVFEAGDLTQSIIRERKYDALLFGEVIGKDLDLYAFWHSSQRNTPGLNLSMYVNAKTDKLLEDARTTSDETIRLQKYAEFDAIVRSEIPAIFLCAPNFIYIMNEKVKGVDLETVTSPWDRWNDVNTWYITTDNVWKFFKENMNLIKNLIP